MTGFWICLPLSQVWNTFLTTQVVAQGPAIQNYSPRGVSQGCSKLSASYVWKTILLQQSDFGPKRGLQRAVASFSEGFS